MKVHPPSAAAQFALRADIEIDRQSDGQRRRQEENIAIPLVEAGGCNGQRK